MAQGSDRRTRRLGLGADGGRTAEGRDDGSPSALRAAIAETREDLARHLGELKHHLVHPHLSDTSSATETHMPTAKKKSATRSTAAGGSSSKARSSTKPASQEAKGRAPADS